MDFVPHQYHVGEISKSSRLDVDVSAKSYQEIP